MLTRRVDAADATAISICPDTGLSTYGTVIAMCHTEMSDPEAQAHQLGVSADAAIPTNRSVIDGKSGAARFFSKQPKLR